MSIYSCEVCGMSLCALTYGKQLIHKTITTDEGTEIHVSACPNGHGMIKSLMCCG